MNWRQRHAVGVDTVRGKFFVKRFIAPGLVFLVTLLAAGCGGGGGGGGGGGSGGDSGPTAGNPGGGTPPPAPEPPPPVPNAIAATFKEGDYLDFYARTESTSVVQGSGGSRTEDAARFRLTLGAPQRVGQTDLFPLTISGRTHVGGLELAPRWKFIGATDGKLQGSLDGQTLQTIYAPDGAATGFFAERETAIAAAVDVTDFSGDYASGPVIRVGNAASSGGCQTIAGERVCSDDSESVSSYEFFKEGVGPFGFRLSRSSSSNGGGFFTSFSSRYVVELVETSLAVDQMAFDKAPVEGASMDLARENPLATVHGGKIYIFGRPGGAGVDVTGESWIAVYDPAANSWGSSGATPHDLGTYVVTTIGDRSYFVGDGATRVYDHVTTAWSTPNTNNPMQTGGERAWKLGAWTPAGGQPSLLLVQTIYTSQSGTRFLIKTYSLATNSWTDVGEFTLTGRVLMDTLSVIGDIVTITSGRARSPIRIDLAALEYTDTDMEASPNDRTSSAASVELNGKVYCFGGRGVNSSGAAVSYRRESEYYDTVTDTWTVIPKLLVGREAATAVALDGKLYVIGGRTSNGEKSVRVDVYTP